MNRHEQEAKDWEYHLAKIKADKNFVLDQYCLRCEVKLKKCLCHLRGSFSLRRRMLAGVNQKRAK